MIKTIIFGTFDKFHSGHKSFLKQASGLGGVLVTVIARDKYVKQTKGRNSLENEKLRSMNVRKTKLADKVLLGSIKHNFYRTIRTNKIDIIALGYDQKPTIVKLRKDLIRHRLNYIKIVRLKPYKPSIYKSSKM